MANQNIMDWLKTIVRKAAAESLKEEPMDVIIRRSDMTVSAGVQSKPIYKVWAQVKLPKCNYEVLVNVAEDGSYSSFRLVG